MNTHTALRKASHFTVFALLATMLLAAPLKPAASAANTTSTVTLRIDIQGVTQEIVIELDETNAPKTSANFKKLASQGFYDGIAFHRVIPNYIVQAGDPLTKDASQKNLWGTGGPGYTLQAEIGLPHERGSIAMARLGDSVNPNKASSGSQFYIALARLPKLDRKYTVFGKVISGLQYLDQIAQSPTDSNNNPSERIEIVVSSASGGITPSVASTPVKLATPPAAMSKTPTASGSKKEAPATLDTASTADSEPEAKKKSWFKRKFSLRKKKADADMAEVDESTPAPTPAPAAKPAKKSLPKPKPTAKPAASIASNTNNVGNDEAPSYRNDNKTDSRSAITAPAAADTDDDAGISLADEMKTQATRDDADEEVVVREEKNRSMVGRFLYRYW